MFLLLEFDPATQLNVHRELLRFVGTISGLCGPSMLAVEWPLDSVLSNSVELYRRFLKLGVLRRKILQKKDTFALTIVFLIQWSQKRFQWKV